MPLVGEPLRAEMLVGSGGSGIAGGGDGSEVCEALLRIIELELDRLPSFVLERSWYFAWRR